MSRLLGAALVLAGCAPAFEWRELQPAQTGLVATFPCKPDAIARQLELARQTVELVMHACRADGATFAVAAADVGDPARVAAALDALAAATQDNLGAPAATPRAVQVAGMTPNDRARRLALHGRLPQGEAVSASTAVFSRGTRVVQATVLGLPDDHEAVQTFFAGLRFAP